MASTRSFPKIDLTASMTPWLRAVAVETGPVSREKVAELERRTFDQAPVITFGRPIGLVLTSRLKELADAGESLVENDSGIIRASIRSDPNLAELLDFVAEHGSGMIKGDDDSASSPGFLTLSDLNKHSFRAAIYPLFAELEIELAARVDRHFDDPWTWLDKLDTEKQARLVGYWEISKRNNVDVGPTASTMLSELVRIVGGTPELRAALGFSSRNKWDDFVGHLADIRNCIMHPVRPLVTSIDDVADLRGQLERVLTLLSGFETENSRDATETRTMECS